MESEGHEEKYRAVIDGDNPQDEPVGQRWGKVESALLRRRRSHSPTAPSCLRETRTCSLGGGRRPAPHGAPPPTRQLRDQVCWDYLRIARDPDTIPRGAAAATNEITFSADFAPAWPATIRAGSRPACPGPSVGRACRRRRRLRTPARAPCPDPRARGAARCPCRSEAVHFRSHREREST